MEKLAAVTEAVWPRSGARVCLPVEASQMRMVAVGAVSPGGSAVTSTSPLPLKFRKSIGPSSGFNFFSGSPVSVDHVCTE